MHVPAEIKINGLVRSPLLVGSLCPSLKYSPAVSARMGYSERDVFHHQWRFQPRKLGARPRGDGPGVYAPSGVQVAGQGSADSKLLTYY